MHSGEQPVSKTHEDLEQELAQLELFCLINGLSLELFDQWKLERHRPNKDN
jgi:hypothetical protein